ncbi:MAG: HD domain-containing protein [Patescibacteria group bacterium]
MTINELLEKHNLYEENPNLPLLRKSFDFAEVAHLGQKRLSGEEMIQHPLAVADILAEMRADSVTLAAALLHDVIEETGIASQEIEKEFGTDISDLVLGLTAVKSASERARRDGEDLDNLRHLILSTVKDPRVLAIRLAEKIHNLRTSRALPGKDRRQAAERVFAIWAPLAGLMGVYRLKAELEDLAFGILNPKEHEKLSSQIEKQSAAVKEAINLVKNSLEVGAAKEGLAVAVTGRTKHLYGVYRKLDRYGKAGGKFYDALGTRAIVSQVEECYRILDLARRFWEEEPSLFDDYIAHPKDNGYQSIHAVFKVEGKLVEIQIRTNKMHERAEYGLAAHPLYKLKEAGTGEKITAIKNLIQWEKGTKLNLFPDNVFVITPKGDVKVLPKGATPVDFAYAVHTRVGDECREAKVDGQLKPLDYELKTGEIVEIITQKGKKPSLDWLKFVKTGQARDQIEKFVRRT